MWNLSRPKPALPNSYFWTWDHSANFVLDDPGTLNFGCRNRYLKRPETYLEDYRRIADLAAGLGVKDVLIWGFIRDSHGGIDYAKRVVDYARSKGVGIVPGVGTTWYGGMYYEGEHPFNIETFVKKHPEARMLHPDGALLDRGACATNPAFLDWLRDGMRWLFAEFDISGANLENGDYLVCHCPGCNAHKASWPAADPDFFRLQALSYEPALKAIQDELANKIVTWATYTGFVPGADPEGKSYAYMGCKQPALIDMLPPESVAQWTLSEMVLRRPLPLTAWLDNGAPDQVFDNPRWPKGLRPPSRRNVGFLHQASQWSHIPRYEQAVSSIKEGCLRAFRAGLEGVSIHAEVSPRHIPWALNYLAFSHFIHWPEDSLRDFGKKTLGQVFGSEDEGEAYAELLAHWDAGTLTEAHKHDLTSRTRDLRSRVESQALDLERWRFWDWLSKMASGETERHTVSFF